MILPQVEIPLTLDSLALHNGYEFCRASGAPCYITCLASFVA